MARLKLVLKDERGGNAVYPLTVKIRKSRQSRRAAKVYKFSRTCRGRSSVEWDRKPGRYWVTVEGPHYFDKAFECEIEEPGKTQVVKLRSIWEVPAISKITGRRRKLLDSFLAGAKKWNKLQEEAQTTFLAITQALAQIRTGEHETALDHIKKIDKIVGDPSPGMGNASVFRLFVTYNELFERWIKSGARYAQWRKKNRKTVSAMGHTRNRPERFKFPQSRKTKSKVPNLQWTYKKNFRYGEIDLDGRRFFKHLTRRNSDVTAWYKKFVRKYGNPGFTRRDA